MTSLVLLSAALTMLQAADPHVIETHQVKLGVPLSGSDFLLIAKAAQRPEMRGRDLSCYEIMMKTELGVRTVAFLGIRDEPPAKQGEIVLAFPKQNPRCPDVSFEIDNSGRVQRVLYSRH